MNLRSDGLYEHFRDSYEEKYGEKYKGNSHKERWVFKDMLNDFSYDRCWEIIEYYFKLTRKHDVQWLAYNYDKIDHELTLREKEREIRNKMLESTKRLVEGGI